MENQDQKQTDVNASQTAQPPEPAGPQPPEPAVKSRQQQVQETVDRNLAAREAREGITEDVIAKRKQTAALESQKDFAAHAASEALEADKAVQANQAKTGPALARGLRNAADMVDSKTAEAAKAAEAVPAEAFPAEAFQGEDEATQATAAILADVMTKAEARELREIEMHNSTMDAITEIVAQMQAMCDLQSDIAGSLQKLSYIAEKLSNR